MALGDDAVDVRLRWLGHSTVLVELPGLTLLTDPLFVPRLGPLRRHGPTPDPGELPAVDAVLVSHAHPDHFDARSLRMIPGDPEILVPRGMGPGVRRTTGRANVREMRLGEEARRGPWTVHAVRARHWRWPLSPAARSIGFLVDGPIGLWFAGDTGEFRGMRELAGRVDVALLPIGRWGPQPTPGHLGPEAAARVAAGVGAAAVLPIHWGTLYPRGLDRVAAGPLHGPAARFHRAIEDGPPGIAAPALEPGESWTVRLPRRSGGR